jgi:hypothetical protein
MARRIYIDPDDFFKSRNEPNNDLSWYLIQKLLEKKDDKKEDKKDDKKKDGMSTAELVMWLNIMAIIVGPIYWNWLQKVIH